MSYHLLVANNINSGRLAFLLNPAELAGAHSKGPIRREAVIEFLKSLYPLTDSCGKLLVKTPSEWSRFADAIDAQVQFLPAPLPFYLD